MAMGVAHSSLRGWRRTYNVSRLNGSIVLSGKGRDVRLGELLNPPHWFIFSYFPSFLLSPVLACSGARDSQERFDCEIGSDLITRFAKCGLAGSRAFTAELYSFISKIEYLKPTDNITTLGRVLSRAHTKNGRHADSAPFRKSRQISNYISQSTS